MPKHKLAVTTDDFIYGQGADLHWFRAGDPHATVQGFDPAQDKIGFDVGHAYNDIPYLGPLYDGLSFGNGYGTATFAVHAVNGNTLIDAYDASGSPAVEVEIVGVLPDQLHGWNLIGG